MFRGSYTDGGARRQSAAIVIAAALSLAGCAGFGLPMDEVQNQAAVASRVKPAVAVAATEAASPSDWEKVRSIIATLPAGTAGSGEIAWHNPGTGSDGTVIAGAATAKTGMVCRAFVSTINDARGIRGYRGEACRADGGDWRIRTAAPTDAAAL
jgi:hypothetical protein